ncbi:N-acetyl-gamma-glutamyl-phosphate reductase [Bacillus pumilus]|uniref:N-acetyl-gamma-glutamyl-phosphate reductase n=1 Tax=Bacillus pumilus TaxID=1408 RepID=A0A2G8IR17_BACPU|nr:N-acetyl-gamma-glutamyl-phosphate reductase [Bacillus pumilus]
MTLKIGIIGATGYGGAELVRILRHHPHVKECILYSSSGDGQSYSQSYPHLTNIADQTLKAIDPGAIVQETDAVFLATPAGVSSELSPKLMNRGVPIIDLSGDLRIQDGATYEAWYKRRAADEASIQQAVYGLSELNREKIEQAEVIANPGCFPTAALLGLAPLMKQNLIDESMIIIDAKTGVSGAGRSASLGTHFSELNDNFKIYKVNEHQHTPEIEQVLREWNPQTANITFSTHLVPMTRGIMATMYTQLKSDVTKEELMKRMKGFYEDSYFVRVRDHGVYPQTKEVYGSNFCDIGFHLDERTGRLTIVSVIDNLMKGAAGQAVQNFNIIKGLHEEAGLTMTPLYP